jgi:putative ABC transport system permease protein
MEFGPILRSMRRSKVRYGLIVLEIALTLAIVTNCVHMIREVRKELTRPSGFDDEHLLSVRSQPFAPEFRENGYRDNAIRADLDALRSLAGIRAVSNTRFLPWQGGGSSGELHLPGKKGQMLRTQIYNADEGTFATLGVNLIEGRNFTRRETEGELLRVRELFAHPRALGEDGTPKEKFLQDIVISRSLARLAFADGKALGRRLEDDDGDGYNVVGVIDRFYSPYGWAPIDEYVMFFPNYSGSYEGGSAYLVRTEPGAVESTKAAIEKRLLEVNGGRNLRVRSVLEVKDELQSSRKILLKVLSSVIFLLLFVTSLGIIGLTSFSVAERTHQIGTRRALGARREDILRYFLLENWITTTFGLTLGIFLAVGLNVLLVTQLRGTRMDASLILFGVFLLWAAGLLATYLPALKGARVAPAVATRNV